MTTRDKKEDLRSVRPPIALEDLTQNKLTINTLNTFIEEFIDSDKGQEMVKKCAKKVAIKWLSIFFGALLFIFGAIYSVTTDWFKEDIRSYFLPNKEYSQPSHLGGDNGV